jgi:hypothetical protein
MYVCVCLCVRFLLPDPPRIVVESAQCGVCMYACMYACTSMYILRFIFIAHGGGKRCLYSCGCQESATDVTVLCITRGGDKRCQYAGGVTRLQCA